MTTQAAYNIPPPLGQIQQYVRYERHREPRTSERGNDYVPLTLLVMSKPRDGGLYLPTAIFCPMNWSHSAEPRTSTDEALQDAVILGAEMLVMLGRGCEAALLAARSRPIAAPANDNQLIPLDTELKSWLNR